MLADQTATADRHLPVCLRPSRMSDRQVIKADFDARHPRGPLAGLVSHGAEELLLEDNHGNPTRAVRVEYFSTHKALFKPVAVRYDGGPLEWLERPAPTPSSSRRPSRLGYMIPRRRSATR